MKELILWIQIVISLVVAVIGSIIPDLIEESRFFTASEIPIGTVESTHSNCTIDHLQGYCSFTLECLNAGGFPVGVCRKDFQFGSCCTKSTTISVINTGVRENTLKQNSGIECGTLSAYPDFDSRIVNGSIATYAQIPWVLSLRIQLSVGGKSQSYHFCGATLLNSEWVATSAHCVYFENVGDVVIRLGEYNSSSTEEVHPFAERKIAKKIVHPEFRIEDFYSDIALLKLNEPVTFNTNIRPICLPGTNNKLVGKNGLVSGWGRTSEISDASPILRTVSLPIMANKDCEKMFLKGQIREDISSVFLCAGFEKGVSDACTGDSGGPLQMKGEDGRIFLAGIVSWGYGCARPFKPGVYTRISEFVPWIIENLS